MKSFIDLENVAKGLMDENQQPSAQQELERLSPTTRDRRRGGESIELYRVGAGELKASTTTDTNNSFSTLLPQNGRLQKCEIKNLRRLPANLLLFFHVKPSDLRFVTWFISMLK